MTLCVYCTNPEGLQAKSNSGCETLENKQPKIVHIKENLSNVIFLGTVDVLLVI